MTTSRSRAAAESHDQQIFRALHAGAWLCAYFGIEPNVRQARRRFTANNVTTDETALEAIVWMIKTYRPDILENSS